MIGIIRKIGRLFLRGNFLVWLWNKLSWLVKKILLPIDIVIGRIVRFFYRYSVKIDENKVMFAPQEGCYTCNPKYICEELHSEYPDIDIVFRTIKGRRKGVPEDIRRATMGTARYYNELYSSKVIVANSYIFLTQPFRLKKGQVLIQTWHGSLGLKKHNKEAIDTRKRAYALEYQGKRTDYCITNSTLENSSLRETYWPDKPLLMYGHARNDIFFPRYDARRKELRETFIERHHLDPDTKFAMYAPTFRNEESFEYYDMDFDAVVDALTERFGGKWKMLVRYHPSLRKAYKAMKVKTPQGVINCSGGVDMQEFVAITDVAITDYSSWIYDFILMRKPGFIFATDIKEYCAKDRGFYYPIEETPFLIASSNEELVKNIKAFDEDVYHEKLEKFLADKGCIDDGHASRRAAQLIKNILDGKDDPEIVDDSVIVR